MKKALAHMGSQGHPWLEALQASPEGAVTDLLLGRAAVFPYTRADAPDAARMLVGHLPADDPARQALASGMSLWLNSRRTEPLPKEPARLQDVVRQASEAFEIVSLVDLAEPALELREKYVRWFEWASRLNLAPSRDARSSYFRMLAITQPTVAGRVSEADALAPFWIRLCRESGSTYPNRYLQIGLLGLRRLPGAIERGESPWIAGLAAWALEQSPPDKSFMRAWMPIKRLHPASPKVMRRRVYDVLSQKHFADAGIASPGWWSSDPDFPSAQDARARGRQVEPPAPDIREGIIRDLRDNALLSELSKRLEDLVWLYEQYTNYTGDDYFLVRSFNNVGFELLRSIEDSSHSEKAPFAERLARKVLRYQPQNVRTWSLWRDSLFARGAYDASVALGWESVRRFPNDPFLRNGLAEMLIALERLDEALHLVEGAVKAGAFDATTYSIQSRLHSNFENEVSARQALQAGLNLEPENHDLRRGLELLNEGRTLPLVAKARKMAATIVEEVTTDNDTVTELRRSGNLRSLRDHLQSDDSAILELAEILKSDPTFAYAQILAARHALWHASDHTLPPVAAAFEEALAREDLESLQALRERMPQLESLILLAKAILGDVVAASEVAERLNSPTAADDQQAILLLRRRFQPVFKLIDSGLEPSDAVTKCADHLRVAIYDTNEAVSAPELMVA